jgi:hypothetical protein
MATTGNPEPQLAYDEKIAQDVMDDSRSSSSAAAEHKEEGSILEKATPTAPSGDDFVPPPTAEAPDNVEQQAEQAHPKGQAHANDISSVPNGGLRAWLQVVGSFSLFFNTW